MEKFARDLHKWLLEVRDINPYFVPVMDVQPRDPARNIVRVFKFDRDTGKELKDQFQEVHVYRSGSYRVFNSVCQHDYKEN